MQNLTNFVLTVGFVLRRHIERVRYALLSTESLASGVVIPRDLYTLTNV
jgi:hypothetical protein